MEHWGLAVHKPTDEPLYYVLQSELFSFLFYFNRTACVNIVWLGIVVLSLSLHFPPYGDVDKLILPTL